jgi:hypothetical protein
MTRKRLTWVQEFSHELGQAGDHLMIGVTSTRATHQTGGFRVDTIFGRPITLAGSLEWRSKLGERVPLLDISYDGFHLACKEWSEYR